MYFCLPSLWCLWYTHVKEEVLSSLYNTSGIENPPICLSSWASYIHGHWLDGSGRRQNIKSTNYSTTYMQWPWVNKIWDLLVHRACNSPSLKYKFLTWLQGCLVIFYEILYLVWFSSSSSLFRELQDNGVM